MAQKRKQKVNKLISFFFFLPTFPSCPKRDFTELWGTFGGFVLCYSDATRVRKKLSTKSISTFITRIKTYVLHDQRVRPR